MDVTHGWTRTNLGFSRQFGPALTVELAMADVTTPPDQPEKRPCTDARVWRRNNGGKWAVTTHKVMAKAMEDMVKGRL